MDINGRQGKRAICVLAQDALHYRIYDLDPPRPYDEEAMETACPWSAEDELRAYKSKKQEFDVDFDSQLSEE